MNSQRMVRSIEFERSPSDAAANGHFAKGRFYHDVIGPLNLYDTDDKQAVFEKVVKKAAFIKDEREHTSVSLSH